MAITAPPAGGSKAPVVEKSDPAAAKSGGSGPDRAGFDLGGAQATAGSATSTLPPGGPRGATSVGADHGNPKGASALGQGDQSPGGVPGGRKAGEAVQPTDGAVRPPQSAGSDQGFGQGNPDDAS